MYKTVYSKTFPQSVIMVIPQSIPGKPIYLNISILQIKFSQYCHFCNTLEYNIFTKYKNLQVS